MLIFSPTKTSPSIYLADEYRVVLERQGDNDYINASYISVSFRYFVLVLNQVFRTTIKRSGFAASFGLVFMKLLKASFLGVIINAN